MEEVTRAGHVALIGLPNAGKSSLLNALLESKLSIVTPFAQTTRERVVGIDTRDGAQIVFLDTPGMVEPAYLLHHAMGEVIEEAIRDADVVVLLIDGTRSSPPLDPRVIGTLRALGRRFIPAINKVDVARESDLSELLAWALDTFGQPVARISAETREGVDALRASIADRLPGSPALYPEDELSTQSTRFFVSELIRETIFEMYREEVPYSTAVRIEEFREGRSPILIRATVYVERESQKGIILGRRGTAIRDLGTAARAKIEDFLGERVYLELWVKVLPKWRKDPLELSRFGFPIPQNEERR